MSSATLGVPTNSTDPFSPEILEQPYVFHEALREAGPAVRLSHYGVWALARYAAVKGALSDPQSFSSARGVGLQDFAKEKPWRPPSVLIETDPPLHTRTRAVLTDVLSPETLKRLRVVVQDKAEAMADRLIKRQNFDAVHELAVRFPLDVIPDLIGIKAEGRDNLLPFSDMVFNSFGPDNAIFQDSLKRSNEVVAWVYRQCERDALAPGSFGARVYDAADAGRISELEASILVRAFLSAGLDTTISGLSAAIFAFATNPEQWDLLLANPSLAQRTFDEVIRWESPIQTFFRTTTRAVDIEGVEIPEGEKVVMFLGAANRDPRRWEDPERFNIRRATSGHVAFGFGIHACVGQMVARLEAEQLLTALLKRVKRIELTGSPRRKLNNSLRGFSRLPVTLHRH